MKIFLCVFSVLPAFILVAVIGSNHAGANVNNVYSISNIEVEATASSAVHARKAAILEGHAIALQRLLRRLTLPEDWPRLPVLSGKEAQLLSVGYTTAGEKNSATHYIGQISVRFVADRVRSLLRQNDIPFGDIQVNPILVVPVFDLSNGRRHIWDNQNRWRKAWGRPDIYESLAPFTLPIGDIEDIIALPIEAVLQENRRALFRLARRYQAQRVLLAYARLEQVEWQGETGYALSVRLNIFTKDRPDLNEELSFAISGSPDPTTLMDRAVDNILQMTSIVWKRRIIVEAGGLGEQEVEVKFQSMSEWRALSELLNQVPVLEEYQVKRINNRGALLTFTYSGSKDILSLALKQKNIDLIFPQEETKPWQIKLQR